MLISVKESLGMEEQFLSDVFFQRIRELIYEKLGFHYPDTKRFQIEQALKDRLEAHGSLGVEEYANLLQATSRKDPEWKALTNLLSIRETSFFRNPAQFGVLKDYILPRLIRKRQSINQTIRIWCAGCSTGQEPYSVGMVLTTLIPDIESWNISILATDISTIALSHAMKGKYNDMALRSLRESDKNMFFESKGKGKDLSVIKPIRKMITFAEHNLVHEPYSLSQMQNVDIIFCRNVTIYFDVETTRRVSNKFYDCLNENGVLFIGHSETLWKISEKFKTIGFARTYIYQKDGEEGDKLHQPFSATHQLSYETRIESKPPPGELPSGNTKEPEETFKAAVEAVRAKEYDRAVSLFKRFQPGDPQYIAAKMDMSILLANQAKYDEAILSLQEIIKHDNLHEWAYYHLGVLYNRKGEFRKACESLDKALYANPKNVVASYHLAEIFFREKDYKMARRSFKTTLKNLEKLPEDTILPYSGDLTPATLSLACHRQLQVLERETS